MSFQRGGFRPYGGGWFGTPMIGSYVPQRGGLSGSGFGLAPLVRPPRGGGSNRGARPTSNKGNKSTTPVKSNNLQKSSSNSDLKKDTKSSDKKVDEKVEKKEDKKDDKKVEKKDEKKVEKKDDKKNEKKDDKKDDKKDEKKGGKTPTGKGIKVEPNEPKSDQKKDEKKPLKKFEVKKDPKVEPKPVNEKPDVKPATVKPEKVKKEFSQANVTLDKLNSELHLVIEADGLTAGNMKGEGFQYMWGGVRGTHGVSKGKVCYEVHLLENIKVDLKDEKNPNVARIGWSVDNSDYQLGEDKLSWGYGGTAKSSYDSKFLDYGKRYTVGDVITCYIDFESNPKAIFYMLNGEYLGVAFRFNKELEGKAVFPHVTCKNMRFRVNFGKIKPKHHVTNGFRMIQDVSADQLVLPIPSPKSPKEAEIIMMVGLPACGKSFWCEKYAQENRDKKYYILGTNNIIDRMKVSGLLRKRNYHGRWEVLIKRASLVLNKLFTVAKKNPRNYILDQTNVYFTARRRKMEPFSGYKKIAAVIVNKPEVLISRTEKQQKVEGKIVPEAAVMEMKFNFTLPEKGPSFDEVWYLEETLPKAQELAAAYRREGSNFKNKGKRKPENQNNPESSPSNEKKQKLDPKIISRGIVKPSNPDESPKTNSAKNFNNKTPGSGTAKDFNNKTPGSGRFSNNESSTPKHESQSKNSFNESGGFNRSFDGNKSKERESFSNTPNKGKPAGNLKESANRNERNDRQFPSREDSRNTPNKDTRDNVDQRNTFGNKDARGLAKDRQGNPAGFDKTEKLSSLMDLDRTPRRENDDIQRPQFRNRDESGNQGGNRGRESPSRGFNDFRNSPRESQGGPDKVPRNEFESPIGRGRNEYSNPPTRGYTDSPARAEFQNAGRGYSDLRDSSARGGFGSAGRGYSDFNDSPARRAYSTDIGRTRSFLDAQDSAVGRGGKRRSDPATRKRPLDVNKYDPVGNRGGYYSALQATSESLGLQMSQIRSRYTDTFSRLDEPARSDRAYPPNDSSRFDRLNAPSEPYRFGRNYSLGQEEFRRTDSYSSFDRERGYQESPKQNDSLESYQHRKDERFDQYGRESYEAKEKSSGYTDYRNSQGGERGYQDSQYNAGGANEIDDPYQSSRPYNPEPSHDTSGEFGRSRGDRGDTSLRSDDMNRSNTRRYDDYQESEPVDNYSAQTQSYDRQRQRAW